MGPHVVLIPYFPLQIVAMRKKKWVVWIVFISFLFLLTCPYVICVWEEIYGALCSLIHFLESEKARRKCFFLREQKSSISLTICLKLGRT